MNYHFKKKKKKKKITPYAQAQLATMSYSILGRSYQTEPLSWQSQFLLKQHKNRYSFSLRSYTRETHASYKCNSQSASWHSKDEAGTKLKKRCFLYFVSSSFGCKACIGLPLQPKRKFKLCSRQYSSTQA